MAPKGNTSGTKLKDPDVRQEAYRQYCDHIASGMPKEAFFFDHPFHSVTFETLDKYIAENPTEFCPLLMKKARAARYNYWMTEGKALMKGAYKGGSPVVWQTMMRNMFRDIGWDRDQYQIVPEELRKPFEQIMQHIAGLQSNRIADSKTNSIEDKSA